MKLPSNSLPRVAAMLALALSVSAMASAAVTASPDSVTIKSPTQHETITLTHDGKPVAASAVKGFTFKTGKSSYAHMLKLEKHDGNVTIYPSTTAEIGSYDLNITTTYGDVHVTVEMPLSDLPDTLENRAKAMGITPDELALKEGIATRVGRDKVTFSVTGPYYVGDVIKLDDSCPANRDYEWKVNGTVAKQGHGHEVFEYTFDKPGTYEFGYREFEGSAPKAEGSVSVSVSPRTATTK